MLHVIILFSFSDRAVCALQLKLAYLLRPRSSQVPAAENAGEWPEKQLVDAWPVTERGGFVWLFYGSKDLPEEERPPIPMVPELEDGTWKPVYGSVRALALTRSCRCDRIVLSCPGVL